MKKPKVIFNNVYKEYSLYKSNKDKLVDFIMNKGNSDSFYAVKDVSFEVYPGETIGVIGINGSGKSTLSNMLAEVIPPTSGDIEIDGETSLIAISVGLNGQLSGFENIYLKCMMHGMSDYEIKKVEDKIVEFADIGSFMNQPVKNYSSGMKSRLGFAISVHTNPDILVIDEALSVGDQTFYDKCLKKIDEFKREGKTIFFVSHSTTQVRSVSDRVIWMHYGEIKEFGEKDKVLNNYNEFILWFNKLTEKEKVHYKSKMFEAQFPTENDTVKLFKIKREINRKKQKEKNIFRVQSIIMSIITLIFSALIISGISLGTAWDKVLGLELSLDSRSFSNQYKADQNSSEIIDDKIEVVKINTKGYVQIDNTFIFDDINMSNKKIELPLFEKVEVVEKINDEIYKILVSDREWYVLINNINIDKELKEVDLTIDSFLPHLTDEFNESYLYYLSFLNGTITTLQEKLQGENQIKVQPTSVLFIYLEGDIVYHSLDGEVIHRIELTFNPKVSEELYKKIEKNSLSDKDETVFYLETENHYYLIDFSNEKLTIEQKL